MSIIMLVVADRPRRTPKYRLLKVILWGGNHALRSALRHDIAPRAFALLETIGRRSGRPRRTPVGNGLEGDTFWLIAAHGHQADFVRNIAKEPGVRVKVGGTWRRGTATTMAEDDTRARSEAQWCPPRWCAVGPAGEGRGVGE